MAWSKSSKSFWESSCLMTCSSFKTVLKLLYKALPSRLLLSRVWDPCKSNHDKMLKLLLLYIKSRRKIIELTANIVGLITGGNCAKSPIRTIDTPPNGKCFLSGKASWSLLLILYKKPGEIIDISSMTINLVCSKLDCRRISGSPSKSSRALLACLVTGIWRRAWSVLPSIENAAVPVGAAVERMSRWAPCLSLMYRWMQLSE